MIERQKEIEAQKKQLMEILQSEKGSDYDEKKLIELSKLNAEEFGQIIQQVQLKKEQQEDMYHDQDKLRNDRKRQRAEQQLKKEAKDRSAGELALMFMGINQVAYDLLVENPMTGYMNEIVFSRVLGHDEIEEGTYWVDTVQCWVC